VIADSVVTLHTDVYGCGVARFNAQLANMLRVPVVAIAQGNMATFQAPIISVKIEELNIHAKGLLQELALTVWAGKYGLWLHDGGDGEFEYVMALNAKRVWVGHEGIHRALLKHGAKPETIKTMWSPCTVNHSDHDVLSLFVMGMAHKFNVYWHQKLRLLLEDSDMPYEVNFSAAPHVGHELDVAYAKGAMRGVYGERAHYLGALYDEAAYRFIRSSDMVAAFYEGGVKPNSSVAMAAMHWGGSLVTNFASNTPRWMVHEHNCFDIGRLSAIPSVSALKAAGSNAFAMRRENGWASLVTEMKK